MIGRVLNPLKEKSFFLFGARGTGKSTYLEAHYPAEEHLHFDLLDPITLDDLRLDIERLRRIVCAPENAEKTVIIDEVQKLPKLLDVVHQLIFKEKRIFILTGSSARRLKQESSNMLAGRALVYNLFPFTSVELGEKFNLNHALQFGLLPDAYLAPSPELSAEILRAYILTYVEKEVQLEQWVRKLEPFRRFLNVAGQMNGKLINRAAIARDVGVDDMTIASYYEILEDTLLGVTLPAFHRSVRKSQRSTPKFYFIDTGVVRSLTNTLRLPLNPSTSAYGEIFEHFIFLELYKLASYYRKDWTFSFFQTKEGHEIDLVIERPGEPLLLLEVKSTDRVSKEHADVIERLGPEIDSSADQVLLSQDLDSQTFGKTQAMHWQKGLRKLFQLAG